MNMLGPALVSDPDGHQFKQPALGDILKICVGFDPIHQNDFVKRRRQPVGIYLQAAVGLS